MTISAEERVRQTNIVTFICMGGNILLTIFKFAAGILGASAAMVADAMHSFSDIFTDIVLLFGVRLGSRPADEDHPYGHGRIETFTALIISAVLIAAAAGIFMSGAKAVYNVLGGGTLAKPGMIALVMALISIISKEAMYRYSLAVGKKIDSMAVISNAWHHRSDAFSSVATFIGIGGAIALGSKWTILDPIAAMLVSVFILIVGLEIAKNSIEELLDKALPKKKVEEIYNICLSVDGTSNPHHIKTRKIGYRISIDMHVMFDKDTSFKEVFVKMCEIREKLKEVFGQETFISIHPKPF
ncbi:cation diffusion facilitator family transporter [Elusimicrobium simillimum]|uniref:cation diffusion facilitator family transporter n=1 Tax=Elusimicrobium simillimum TaxID=3143438 RepID=UPI003C6EBF36